MFGIPWRLIAGVIIGAMIVKESRRGSEYYDSARRRTAEAIRKAKASWSSPATPESLEPSKPCPEMPTSDVE